MAVIRKPPGRALHTTFEMDQRQVDIVCATSDAAQTVVEHAPDEASDPIAVNDRLDIGPGRHVWMCATLGKASGGSGGIIAGSSALIAGLKEVSSFYHGAAAPTAPFAGATAKALEMYIEDRIQRERLARNIQRLRN